MRIGPLGFYSPSGPILLPDMGLVPIPFLARSLILIRKMMRGGLRFVALVVTVLCALTTTLITPNEVKAEEVTVPQCDANGWATSGNLTSVSGKTTIAGREWLVTAEFGGEVNVTYSRQDATIERNEIFYPSASVADQLNQVTHCNTIDGQLLWKWSYSSGYTTYAKIDDEFGIIYYADSLALSVPSGPNHQLDSSGRIIFNDSNKKTIVSSITGSKLNVQAGHIASSKQGLDAVEIITVDNQYKNIKTDANKGIFKDGTASKFQTIDTNYKYITDDKPTLDGYILNGWNTKPDGTGDDVSLNPSALANGQTIYAQWTKDPGNPVKVTLSCTPRTGTTGALCSVVAYYKDAPEQTRELLTSGKNVLSWSGDGPIAGVNLNQSGYAGNVSCITQASNGGSQCYYVSVTDKPEENTSYQAQMPTTGAPEGLSTIGAVAVMLGLVGLVVVRRDRV